MPSMSRERFLQEYVLELNKEFELHGDPAAWAPVHDGPKVWGTEDASIALPIDDPLKGNVDSSAIAISPDEVYVAVSTNARIRIYNVQTKQKHSELIGHLSNVHGLYFAPSSGTEYTLFSEGAEVGGADGQIIRWRLNEKAQSMTRKMPFAIESMADAALGAVQPALIQHHGLEDSAMQEIRSGFVESLQLADTKNRAADMPIWEGHFPSFGTEPVSHDGKSVFYIAHGKSTQGGMRPPEELPQLIVMDIASSTRTCRLMGHEDAIMWAGWSLDDRTIATSSWDEHFRIWDAQTGECKHTIGPMGGQNWSGAFSPDGKHVLLSGGQPVNVSIYNIETGENVKRLEQEGLKLSSWMRYLSWHPEGKDIALINRKGVIVWTPFEDKVEKVFEFKTDDSMLTNFVGMSIISWTDGGRKLLLQDSEDTTFIWDRKRNVKWRFQRPQGTPLKGDHDAVFAAKTQTVISLDGDSKVRFWKLAA